jgi:hypothetical protein
VRQVQAIRHRHTRPYPRAPQLLQPGKLDAAKIAGHEREQNGQVYKITVGCDDLSLKEMLRLTWAAFVGTDQSVAIHHHMIGTQPAVIFLHALEQLGKGGRMPH